jgi:hypothetical protein
MNQDPTEQQTELAIGLRTLRSKGSLFLSAIRAHVRLVGPD